MRISVDAFNAMTPKEQEEWLSNGNQYDGCPDVYVAETPPIIPPDRLPPVVQMTPSGHFVGLGDPAPVRSIPQVITNEPASTTPTVPVPVSSVSGIASLFKKFWPLLIVAAGAVAIWKFIKR